ncbi:hypothetical protein AB3K78_10065 [Leucobacter sp. HNU]|uniref:hypothetical protein n=1 Tax=Leucobacter sp. HNU TaxID=3236805 RepID=UPI003A7FFFA7
MTGHAPVAHGAPSVTPVPFAAELQPLIDSMAANPMPPLTEENLRDGGAAFGPGFPDGAGAVAGRGVSAEELVIPGPAGSPISRSPCSARPARRPGRCRSSSTSTAAA